MPSRNNPPPNWLTNGKATPLFGTQGPRAVAEAAPAAPATSCRCGSLLNFQPEAPRAVAAAAPAAPAALPAAAVAAPPTAAGAFVPWLTRRQPRAQRRDREAQRAPQRAAEAKADANNLARATERAAASDLTGITRDVQMTFTAPSSFTAGRVTLRPGGLTSTAPRQPRCHCRRSSARWSSTTWSGPSRRAGPALTTWMRRCPCGRCVPKVAPGHRARDQRGEAD